MEAEPFRGHEKTTSGWIEVICGSMFSGKTEELIRRLNRAIIAGLKVEIFKPAIDVRYHPDQVVSHDQTSIRSTPVSFAEDILLLSGDSSVIGIDESQFFDRQLVQVVTKLADHGKRVIVAGLDMDFMGKPFAPMDAVMAVAEYVTKMRAICVQCGALASFSYRVDSMEEQVVIGEKDKYKAMCRHCYNEAMRKRKGDG
jgi:thymidine kinase